MNSNRITIAYIGGGSVNFGWELITALSDEELSAQVNLYDTEHSLALANEVIGNKLRDVKECRGDIIYVTSDKPREALRNADFVILSITPGSPEEAVTELNLPETYGIFQCSGESAGPAAVIRSLKTLPVYIKYAEMIKECCPDAWVLTLTNPMAECLMTLKRVYPEMKVIGVSGDVMDAQKLVSEITGRALGINIRRREVKTNLLGISGFSWFSELTYNGDDVMPPVRSFAEEYVDSGYEHITDEYKTNPLVSGNKIKFDLFLRYGMVPAVPDRIAADYCGTWYLQSPKVLSSWKQSRVSASYLKKRRIERLNMVKRLMTGDEILNQAPSTEIVPIIRALMGMGNFITNVISLNDGQVTNLPKGTAVETNALISKSSVKPVASGSLSEELMGISMRSAVNRTTLVKAVFEKDLDIAFNAFLNDSLMTTDRGSAAKLYTEMLAGVKENLLYYTEE